MDAVLKFCFHALLFLDIMWIAVVVVNSKRAAFIINVCIACLWDPPYVGEI